MGPGRRPQVVLQSRMLRSSASSACGMAAVWLLTCTYRVALDSSAGIVELLPVMRHLLGARAALTLKGH